MKANEPILKYLLFCHKVVAAGAIIVMALFFTMPADAATRQFTVGDRWIIDAAGRKIDTSRAFHRIIALYGAHTENLYELKAGDQLIGVGRNATWPAEATTKPVYSYRDDLEKFLAAQPDLVIIRPMIDRGYARLTAQLEKHGIAVASLQPGSIDEMFLYWRALGLLTGHLNEAEKMVAQFKQTLGRIRRITSVAPQKKQVYFEAIHDRMRTFTPDAMPIFALEAAGGINVAADAPSRRGTNIADYGKERILSHAHQIDVYLAQVGPMNRPTIAMIKAEPGYQLIRAVREDMVFLIDEQLVSRPTMRLLEGIRRIGAILYPELLAQEEALSGPGDTTPSKMKELGQ
jgi:iron complex transport system substrate-binding protein